MKLGRNSLCHCGSGRKYKRCHYASDKENLTVALDNGLTLTVNSLEVSLVTVRESRIPEWLLGLARDAVRKAGDPGANESNGLTALLSVTAAGEAILNRLIEPLLPREEFYGTGGNRGFENASARKKWVRLSELLGVKPNLQAESHPLKAFLDTIDARNDVLHFKHGRNLRKTEGAPVKGIKRPGEIVVPLVPVLTSPQQPVPGDIVEDKVAPSRAAGYLASLIDVLNVALL